MIGWRRSASGLPLPALAGGGAFVGCLLSGGSALGLGATHRLGGLLPAAGAVVGIAALVGGLAALSAVRFSRGLRILRAQSLRRLQDPSAPLPESSPMSLRSSAEVNELAHTIEALHMRVRVADEVADRHRRAAETASAGMFELLSGLVAAEEGARGQLAAELHDTVAQSLMLARSKLADAKRDPAVTREAADLVGEAEEQVRAVMARTRPPALRDGDLARAVGALRDDLALRYGLVVHIGWPAQPRALPLATAVTVYRFFQEALLNVVKHSDVDEAEAELVVDDDGVMARVTDGGPGFDPDQVRPERGRHVGLGLLRERARLAGGSVEITSWPREGTTLRLRLPLRPSGAATMTLPRAVGH